MSQSPHKPKIWLLIFGVFAIIAGITVYTMLAMESGPFHSRTPSPASPSAAGGASPAAVSTPTAPPTPGRVVRDLVCGMLVDTSKATATSVYLNRRFYFDSQRCKKLFDEDPLKYIPVRVKVDIKPGPTSQETQASPAPEKSGAPSKEGGIEDYWEDTTPSPAPNGGQEPGGTTDDSGIPPQNP